MISMEKYKFYLNGLLQKSGYYSQGEIKSGDYYIAEFKRLKTSGENQHLDSNIYDEINDSVKFSGYTSGESNFVISGSFYTSKDIYLNGQKLISGLNYTGNSTSITLFRSTLNSVSAGSWGLFLLTITHLDQRALMIPLSRQILN